MTDLVIRPLVAGEEALFDSMPDPLPQLRQVSYADGLAGGGYQPEHTWIALRAGRVVGRAAWLSPPGSVGEPWLERFDLAAEPELLTGAETALMVGGVELARDPLACAEAGAYEVIADVDAHRVSALAELERTGFRRLRSRVVFTPA